MKVRIKNKLSFKQARLAVLIAISLGLIFSAVQIAFDFRNVQTRLDTTMLQFLNTVREPASQAAYGLEKILAKRVLSGLFEIKSIVRAEISHDLGGQIATADRSDTFGDEHHIFDLIFRDEQKSYSIELKVEGYKGPVGALTVWIHPHLAYKDFFDRIGIILFLGLLRSIILAALLMAAFYFQLTQRLVRITNQVSALDPKFTNKTQIDMPLPEHQDELGVLSAVFNQYISNQEKHLTELTKSEERRRLSEQRFKVFAESSSDWFWETDTEGRITWMSDTVFEKSGRSFEDIKNLTREEIADTLGSDEDWRPYRSAMKNHEDINDFEYNYIAEDGSVRSVKIDGKPVFSDAGEYLGYQGAASDITERKQTEKNLKAALIEAKRANQAKSEFLATMSHEFRTPLNAILGFSEMLSAQYFGPLGAKNYKEYADDIHTSGEHMLALVNDALDISAIEAGKRPIVKESIAIDELLKDCMKNFEKAAEDGGILLLLEVPDNLPSLYADMRSVTQIVLNILSNAIKFTNRDGTISVSATVSNGEKLISVRDTGIGIPADKLTVVTEPFSQADSNPHKTQEGTGLGLSIVKSLVEVHNGNLNIESEVGTGTTVTVSFPI